MNCPRQDCQERHDLPIPRTSLIGREQQVAEATELLLRRGCSAIELTGPGGAGKTRLAVAVAAAIADVSGRRSICWFGIDHGSRPGGHRSCGRTRNPASRQPYHSATYRRSVAELGTILAATGQLRTGSAGGDSGGRNIEACPSLKILVTSRSCLRIYGEQEFPVAPLAQNSAIELFVQRATAVWPDFAITPENARRFRKSVRGWMDCRWPLSWRLREPRYCRPAPSWTGCKAACNC